MRYFVGVFVLLSCSGFSLVSAQEQEQGTSFFEKRIRPLLAKHCYECHGAKKQENDLRLDRGKDLYTGGVSGKIIEPSKPAASLLIAAVQQVNDDLQMPPEGKLSKTEINDLIAWVKMGAPHPDKIAGETVDVKHSADWKRRLQHWSFQPPVEKSLPHVSNRQWPQQPLDRFSLAQLEKEGMQPGPPAGRRSLIRRVTYDLTGLPPTPAEVNAFVNDDSPSAFERVVERLLASPHYGQRWGRHWLDVVRYADSNGLDENVAHGNAWRYRDWVIDAFNNDMPYDEFVTKQLAGDLLPTDSPAARNANLVATGFLSLGPKVLAEVDETKMEMDIVDEQISTVGQAFLGLTLGCARCHDHKFDPVTQKDYYALAGVFQSTHTMDSFTKIAKWHENELHSKSYEQAKAKHEKLLAEKTRQLNETIAAAKARLVETLGEGAALPKKPAESFPPEVQQNLKNQRTAIETLKKEAPKPHTAMGVTEGEPTNTPVHIRGSHLTLGESQPRNVPAFLRGEYSLPTDSQSGRLELAKWIVDKNHPLTARVIVNRVWRWHFGAGLTTSTDNFGLQGAQPKNQALLDFLATSFAKDWSLKNLHRRILLSATYQMAVAEKGAPSHTAYASIRRLEAEEIRDGMLAVAGLLDETMGGAVIATENRKHIFDHTSKDDTNYSNHRRSVYLPVVRNHLHESFTLFDYTDASTPNGNRNTSIVAPQALYLMNSEFMTRVSDALHRRIVAETSSNEHAIQRLYQLVLSREPTSKELASANKFIARAEKSSSREVAWRLLCQAVLVSNESFYVQ